MAISTGAAHALEAKVSGQINRALMQVSDGTNSELHNVDNSISSTRFRFTGSDEIMPGTKAGIKFEAEFQSNPSNKVSQTSKSVSPTLGERQLNVYFQSSWGKVTLGQTDGAANGGTEIDLSGTTVAQWAGTADLGGAINFRNATVTGPTIGQTTSQQDFASRYDTLRYDTPALGPVKLSVSKGVKGLDANEVALWFSSDLGGGNKLAGALGTSNVERAPGSVDDKTTGGSISWLGSSGFNVTLATSSRDLSATQKGKFSYLKVGYKAGEHAFSIDSGKAKDENAIGDEAKVSGVAWVYKPIKWAEIYAAYKKHTLDRPGSNFDDITIFVVGSRLKF